MDIQYQEFDFTQVGVNAYLPLAALCSVNPYDPVIARQSAIMLLNYFCNDWYSFFVGEHKLVMKKSFYDVVMYIKGLMGRNFALLDFAVLSGWDIEDLRPFVENEEFFP